MSENLEDRLRGSVSADILANPRRIVASVKATDGIVTEALEKGSVQFMMETLMQMSYADWTPRKFRQAAKDALGTLEYFGD